jgi:hypothetical protein
MNLKYKNQVQLDAANNLGLNLYKTNIDIDILTAIGFTPGGSGTVRIYTKTLYTTTQ